ncbi:hypothetical protein Godav_018882 [Gossypium davidsonii]|uniref:Uncharacterized protein n=1 Tax=Gossypium davidsonii TaxID=34287 RepID=A0A7J8QXW6_GOSDV|nr:hypothetical protein [Gossypium davidsonii]
MVVVEDAVWNYISVRIISYFYYLKLTKLISNVDSFFFFYRVIKQPISLLKK